MKKTLLLLLSTVCALTSYAQKSVLFKMQYKPQHTYTSTIAMNMNMEMNVKADSATLAKINESGQQFAMLMQMKSDMGTTMKTGKETGNSMPLTISYDKVISNGTLNGKTMPAPANPMLNQKIIGKILNGKMQVDSIPGQSLSTEQKEAITSTVNNMMNYIKFPEKPLAIGESFTQEVPMNMPIAGISMEMKIKVVYKLLAIKNDIAYFDLDQSLAANIKNQEMVMTMQGSGDGKLEYSITNSFFKNTTSNLKFSYDMKIKEINMIGKADVISTYTVDINKTN